MKSGAIIISIVIILVNIAYAGSYYQRCSFTGCRKLEYPLEKALLERNSSFCEMAGDSVIDSDFQFVLSPGGDEGIRSTSSYCYYQYAIKTSDITVCDKSDDGVSTHVCVQELGTSVSQCEKLADTKTQSTCFYWLAVTKRDTRLCGQMKGEFWYGSQTYDFGRCLIDARSEQQKISDQIQNMEQKKENQDVINCVKGSGKFVLEGTERTVGFNSATALVENCQDMVASGKKDVSLCAGLTQEDSCIRDICSLAKSNLNNYRYHPTEYQPVLVSHYPSSTISKCNLR